jgi:hypothetical protein
LKIRFSTPDFGIASGARRTAISMIFDQFLTSNTGGILSVFDSIWPSRQVTLYSSDYQLQYRVGRDGYVEVRATPFKTGQMRSNTGQILVKRRATSCSIRSAWA